MQRVTSRDLNITHHILDGYVVQDNTPQAGYISWSDVHIQYQGVTYNIQDGYTNYKYVYWKKSVSTTQLIAGDTLPTLTDDDVLLFFNKNGIHMTVPKTTVIDGGLIVSESIMTPAIAANAITGAKIAANTITTTHLTADCITANEIATGAVTADAIAANAIGANAIAAAVITGDKLVGGTITGDKIASSTITANKLASNTITAASGVIADAAITTAKIADGAITNAKIADLDAGKITTGYLNANRIQAGSITADKISTVNSSAIQTEDGGIVATGNLCAGKTVTGTGGSSTVPTDGSKYVGSSYYSFGSGSSNNNAAESAYFEVDLGAVYKISDLRIFFFSGDTRYYWYKVKISTDGTNWRYAVGDSSNDGWVTSAPSTSGLPKYNPTIHQFNPAINIRYIRVYGNGNSVNTSNHVYEIEAYCVPQTTIYGDQITTGTIDASKVNVTNLNATNITTGTLDGSKANITNINASNITSGTLNANRIIQADGLVPAFLPNSSDTPTINHWVTNVYFNNASDAVSTTINLQTLAGRYRWRGGELNSTSSLVSSCIPSIMVSTSYRLISGACYQIYFQDGSTGEWSWQPPNYTGNGYISAITVGGYTIDGSVLTANIFFFVSVLGGVY